MVEVIILLLLVAGAFLGFKRGIIKSGVSFVATVLFIIIAWKLKNPLATALLKFCPFFQFKDTIFVGVSVLNIIIYELIAFFIIFSLLSIILKIIIKVSGLFEKLLNATIVLGLPFKILGAILGVLEMYVVIFISLFILNQINVGGAYIRQSKIAVKIMDSSPVLSNLVGDTYDAFNEIYDLHSKYHSDSKEYNKAALDVLLKYKVINKDQVNSLIDSGKLKVKDAKKVLKKY